MQDVFQNKIISIRELWQFFNHSANLFCITSADGFLQQVNPHVIELLAFSEQELLNSPYLHFIHPEDRDHSAKQSMKVRNQEDIVQFRNRVITAEGNYKWVSWTAKYIPEDNNVYLIGQDCTVTHGMEEKLKEEKHKKHKSLLDATLMGQEKERTEIGKELHDNVNQMLASVLLYHQMALSDKEQSEAMIIKASEIVQKTISEIRSLSKSLVGPDVKKIGLMDCIKDLAETIRQSTSIKIRIMKSGMLENLPPKIKLMIFRVIQEQTNNILKHAEASNVLIQLKRSKNSLFLLIRDDGKGFEVDTKRKGIGLNNIYSRVDIYNGKVEINSAKGEGCTLSVEIPDAMVS